MFLLLMTLMLASVPMSSQASAPKRIPNVSFCDVLTDSQVYRNKTIRVRAVFTRGGEDWIAIYCPGCSTDQNLLKPEYDDAFDRSTSVKIRRLFERPEVTLEVTLIGILDAKYRLFHIVRAERAIVLSKQASSPWRLPEKLKQRNPC